MYPKLLAAERIIGFNVRGFDLPILAKYHPPLASIPLLDVMEEITNFLGRRVSLNSVAQATLGIGKSGNGLEAIRLWRGRENAKLKSYCLDDVRITKEVYEYGLTHRELLTTNWGGEKIKIPVNFDKKLQQSKSFNLQLAL